MKVKKNGKPQGRQTRKAAKSSHIPTSGLSGFLLDSSEAAGKAAFAALAKSRPAFRGIAAAGTAFSFKKMDPESAALNHLDHALESDALKKFVRPKIET